MTVDHKKKDEEKRSLIFGIIAIIVLTVICYAVGSYIVQTKVNLNLKVYGVRFFSQALSMILPIIVYCAKFKDVAGKDPASIAFTKKDDGSPFVYDGWSMAAIITGIITAVIAFGIYALAFKGKMVLVSLLAGVWIVQGILSAAVFFIPAFRPLKRIS